MEGHDALDPANHCRTSMVKVARDLGMRWHAKTAGDSSNPQSASNGGSPGRCMEFSTKRFEFNLGRSLANEVDVDGYPWQLNR
jgi:hypothetical protein